MHCKIYPPRRTYPIPASRSSCLHYTTLSNPIHAPDTYSLRSVVDLLHHTINDSALSFKGCHFITHPIDFLRNPHAYVGSTFRSYVDIHNDAANLSLAIQAKHDVTKRVVMCHSDSYQEQITLFWACVFAGAIPCILPKLAYDNEQRAAFLHHLRTILVSDTDPYISPLAIVSDALHAELDCCPDIERTSIGVLLQSSTRNGDQKPFEKNSDQWDDVLCLHLTSGSTGFPKAVAITHGNALSASAGKSAIHENTPETRFLNWLRMDHAAGLVEFHIRPMFTRADQFHIPSRDVLTDPLLFLRVLSHARIHHAFGPMFFHSALLRALKRSKPGELDDVKLQESLRIVSGGEPTNTTTCVELVQEHLVRLGAPDNVIIPGFGLSETSAGFCFNRDLRHGRYVAVTFRSSGAQMSAVK